MDSNNNTRKKYIKKLAASAKRRGDAKMEYTRRKKLGVTTNPLYKKMDKKEIGKAFKKDRIRYRKQKGELKEWAKTLKDSENSNETRKNEPSSTPKNLTFTQKKIQRRKDAQAAIKRVKEEERRKIDPDAVIKKAYDTYGNSWRQEGFEKALDKLKKAREEEKGKKPILTKFINKIGKIFKTDAYKRRKKEQAQTKALKLTKELYGNADDNMGNKKDWGNKKGINFKRSRYEAMSRLPGNEVYDADFEEWEYQQKRAKKEEEARLKAEEARLKAEEQAAYRTYKARRLKKATKPIVPEKRESISNLPPPPLPPPLSWRDLEEALTVDKRKLKKELSESSQETQKAMEEVEQLIRANSEFDDKKKASIGGRTRRRKRKRRRKTKKKRRRRTKKKKRRRKGGNGDPPTQKRETYDSEKDEYIIDVGKVPPRRTKRSRGKKREGKKELKSLEQGWDKNVEEERKRQEEYQKMLKKARSNPADKLRQRFPKLTKKLGLGGKRRRRTKKRRRK